MCYQNIYDQYCAYLKSKQGKYPKGTLTEKHRIFPGFEGGNYDPSNVLDITFSEHCLAHYYRYLSYRKTGDKAAFLWMSGQTEEARRALASYAGQIGGKRRSQQTSLTKTHFFSKEWQRLFGNKNGGKRNKESEHIKKLNEWITEYDPEQRSRAGKRGGRENTDIQRKEKTHFFDSSAYIQALGNLKRWGFVINNERVDFDRLSEDFIELVLWYRCIGKVPKNKKVNPKAK